MSSPPAHALAAPVETGRSESAGGGPVSAVGGSLDYGLAREQYDALVADNWSTLKYLAPPRGSPALYQFALKTKRDTPSMRMGRATHAAVLEPVEFHSFFPVWTGGRRAGKEWEAFAAINKGYDILTEDEHAECLAIRAAVFDNPDAAMLLERGRPEVSLSWGWNGATLKARLDWINPLYGIVELKRTKDPTHGFKWEASKYLLHGQAAMQIDGLAACGHGRAPHFIIAVGSEPPHEVVVYRTSDGDVRKGRGLYQECVRRLQACRASGEWPGYATGIQELVLPETAEGFEVE